ncbi:MAG TPA: amidase family protein [Mycobacteriales bacterium]
MTEDALTGAGVVDIAAGRVDGSEAAAASLARIDAYDDRLHTVLDLDRTAQGGHGPLAGVPFLVKGNVDTVVPGLPTTAGSAAMAGARPPKRNAPALQRLLDAGALLLGTANLSEWANFRSLESSSGWSALGGQCRNPYDTARSPGGSSAGSAAAVAARFVPFAIGTETDGSILCPAALNGVVGIKPTLGLVPAGGVIPIAASQDVVGPIARTVEDAARVLSVLAGRAIQLDRNSLQGKRIGVAREVYCGYDTGADAALEDALGVLSRLGATVVDPADVATAAELRDAPHEVTVLTCEFKDDLASYLAARDGAPRDLGELMAWNAAHADVELVWFGQDILEKAWATGGRADPAYPAARADALRLARDEGIDATLRRHELDALVWPTYPRAWPIRLGDGGDGHIAGAGSTPTAVAGYPAVTVPSGLADGLPVGIMFAGTAGSDAALCSYAYAYERARPAIPPPQIH